MGKAAVFKDRVMRAVPASEVMFAKASCVWSRRHDHGRRARRQTFLVPHSLLRQSVAPVQGGGGNMHSPRECLTPLPQPSQTSTPARTAFPTQRNSPPLHFPALLPPTRSKPPPYCPPPAPRPAHQVQVLLLHHHHLPDGPFALAAEVVLRLHLAPLLWDRVATTHHGTVSGVQCPCRRMLS